MLPIEARLAARDQKAAWFESMGEDFAGSRAPEFHYTSQAKAQGDYDVSKAGLAVYMGSDPLAGKIFVDDDLIRALWKNAVADQSVRGIKQPKGQGADIGFAGYPARL